LEQLGGGFPCYGFEALDPSDVEDPARCAELLREVQPTGPYRLAGGLPAFETARRLTALGEHVDVVVLFDTTRPETAASYAGRVVLFRARDPHRDDLTLGWDACCADLHVEVVPGDHRSMTAPPHAEVLARHLAAELAGLTGRTSPGITPG
jgi:thioesterase domain-containing protein